MASTKQQAKVYVHSLHQNMSCIYSKKCNHMMHPSRVVLLFAWLVGVTHAGLEVRYSKDTHHQTRLLTNYDLGLQHIELSGVLHVDGVDTVVTVLTFLKTSRAQNGSLVWHGRATVYDPTQLSLDTPGWIHHVSPQNIYYKAQPRFYLKSSTLAFSDDDSHQEYDFVVPQAHLNDLYREDSGHPWLLHMVMDDPPEPLEFYFGIDDWEYTALFAEPLMALPAYVQPGWAPLSIYSILTPLFVLDPETAVKEIAQYVLHNAEIGMNATILYERGPYLSHLQGDTALHKLMRSGDLQIMLWDHGFGKTMLSRQQIILSKLVYVKFDQIQIYDHALTAFSGMNAYLYIADHDDFLILRKPMEAPALHNTIMHGCLQGSWSSILVGRNTHRCVNSHHLEELYKCLQESIKWESDQYKLTKALLFVDDVHSAGIHGQKGGVSADIVHKTVYPDKSCVVVAHVDLNDLPGAAWTEVK